MSVEQERLVFSSSVEALLLRGLTGKVTPELKNELKAFGVDLDKPLLPAYPSIRWLAAVSHVAKRVFPELPEDEAQYLLGERTVYGLEETLVGKAMVALARVVGARRSVMRFPSTAKTGSNFSALSVRELGPFEFEITSSPFEGHVEFLRGCMHAAISIAGARDVQVKVVEHDPAKEKVVLHARWTQ